METKANYVAVGAFTVLVFMAAFAFVYWIARVDTGGESARLDIMIEGSVTGLAVGSPVKFNGIDVGKVTGLRFDASNPRAVIAQSTVRRDLPITAATRAVLGFTGLTGIAHVELEGGDATQPNVFAVADESGGVATITADPSAVNNLLATAQDIFNRADTVLTELEGLVVDSREPLRQTLENASKVTDALAANADGVDDFLKGLGDLGKTLDTVALTLDRSLAGIDRLVAEVKPEDVRAVVADVRRFSDNLGTVSDDFGEILASAQTTLKGLETVGTRIDETFNRVDTLIAAVEPDKVSQAVDGFAATAKTAQEIAADLGKLSDTLDGRRDDIDTIVTNVSEMAERLNAASVRVDGVLAKLDGFLGTNGEAGGDLIAEASATLKSFREVADTLNSRLDGITSGLERFSNRGLKDVETLVSDTRRSISRIESAITALEQDPQRLLFGGEGSVKRFDGRQRR